MHACICYACAASHEYICSYVADFYLKVCNKCKHSEIHQEKCLNPLISIPKWLQKDYFYSSYFNSLKARTYKCPMCEMTSDSYCITKDVIQEPKYLALLDANILTNPTGIETPSEPLALNSSFKNKPANNPYGFLASVNIHYANHLRFNSRILIWIIMSNKIATTYRMA